MYYDIYDINNFLNCYFAAPQPTLGHYRRGSVTHPTLITAFSHFCPEAHQESRNEVGSLGPAEHLGLEPGTARFWLSNLNPLGHPPQINIKYVIIVIVIIIIIIIISFWNYNRLWQYKFSFILRDWNHERHVKPVCLMSIANKELP